MVADSKLLIEAITALCMLSERCQSVAKFSDSKYEWYERSEQFANDACSLVSKLNFIKDKNNGN